jgi:EAL domain-containing protein (putative c-di-GMP-specific phosphodiesterase class I)
MSITARPSGATEGNAAVLVVARGAGGERLARGLEDRGLSARFVTNGPSAIDELVRWKFDVLVLDPDLDDTPGVELVRVVRAYDIEVPIVVLTADAQPFIGAGVMLVAKPVDLDALGRAVARAKQSRRDTKRLRREIVTDPPRSSPEDLKATFARALDEMYIAFQPILEPGRDGVFGYEALMRSRVPSMASPLSILAAAEELDRMQELGQRVRALAASSFAAAPPDALLFVNLHSTDLLDTSLYELSAPLAEHAARVVLEITERATIDDLDDVPARVSVLRFHGFRIAIDDLGAGYAGLTSFATVEPEFVKLDMSLVRNVHASNVRRRLVASVVEACRDLGTRTVAEGIQSPDELRVLRELGCELFQGFLFARPSEGFEKPSLP